MKISLMLRGINDHGQWPGTILTPEEVGMRFLNSSYLTDDGKLKLGK